MRGRKTIPNEIKLLQGNPGRRPIKKSVKSNTIISKTPPAWFDDYAKKEWRRVVNLYESLEIITEGDRPMLEEYCIAYSMWRQMMEHAKLTMVKTASGYPVINPWIGSAIKIMRELKSLAAEFGFSPSSRARIGMPEPKEENEFEEYLKNG